MDIQHGSGLKLIHDLAMGLVHQTKADGAPDFTLRQLSILLTVYLEQRTSGERFIETVRRIGLDPFKERVYAKHH